MPELKARLKALNVSGYSALKKAELVVRLQQELGAIEEEATRDEQVDEEGDDDGEPEEDEAFEEGLSDAEREVLAALRQAPTIGRDDLSAGRAFFCWDDDRKLKYFPVLLKEAVRPRARKIRVACLMPSEEQRGVYTIDPVFNGETGIAKKDNARIDLLFNAQPITGEVWRPIEDGSAGSSGGGPRAWRVVARD